MLMRGFSAPGGRLDRVGDANDLNSAALLRNALKHFREERMRLFERTFFMSRRTRVLDVGGSPEIWQLASVKPRLTFLNLPAALQHTKGNVNLVAGDGRMLPFRDGEFDIVFSNSVIEHVGSREDQHRFAQEAGRVGRHYWIQTPNRRFPIELHIMLPLVHFLPKRLQSAIVHRFTVWERVVRPDEYARAFYLHHFLHELRLLDKRELKELFPGATILVERVLGVPKSLIAVRS